MTEFSALKLFN